MKILFFNLILSLAYADPFYYGNSTIKSESLNLYGLMKDKANFNGKWYKVQTTFNAQNANFRILKIQNNCVILEESSTQDLSTICLQKSKLLRN
ncbi:hypothetical protein [Helicobacter rodentium]|uniref:hypothetical protein n=1 Tax=Helicobacter rodentium TaxID=59617 RepID=UPI00047B2FB8|nr:hypothetical protein [Helicobacter rodentium]